MGKLIQELLKKETQKKRLVVLEREIWIDQAKEVDLLMRQGLSYNAALREMKSMYEKAHSLTDQSIENEQEKVFSNIITEKKG